MMNALQAMDEIMSANDINMNMAAITPVFILCYLGNRLYKFLYYALLKLGTSREETYATFRNILTDIERLLNMRDNPPASMSRNHEGQSSNEGSDTIKPCVLGRDDLGMLMLLIHECRTILWRQRRRFSPTVIDSVSEDFAELAGERGEYHQQIAKYRDYYSSLVISPESSPSGAVGVHQQLQIISRMSRTYPFLKVISTGFSFQYSRLRSSD
jgi:hypothetical protein